MNIYMIIAIGNKSIQDGSHFVPMNTLVSNQVEAMNTLAPEWLS